jgi:hypothetical protein
MVLGLDGVDRVVDGALHHRDVDRGRRRCAPRRAGHSGEHGHRGQIPVRDLRRPSGARLRDGTGGRNRVCASCEQRSSQRGGEGHAEQPPASIATDLRCIDRSRA